MKENDEIRSEREEEIESRCQELENENTSLKLTCSSRNERNIEVQSCEIKRLLEDVARVSTLLNEEESKTLELTRMLNHKIEETSELKECLKVSDNYVVILLEEKESIQELLKKKEKQLMVLTEETNCTRNTLEELLNSTRSEECSEIASEARHVQKLYVEELEKQVADISDDFESVSNLNKNLRQSLKNQESELSKMRNASEDKSIAEQHSDRLTEVVVQLKSEMNDIISELDQTEVQRKEKVKQLEDADALLGLVESRLKSESRFVDQFHLELQAAFVREKKLANIIRKALRHMKNLENEIEQSLSKKPMILKEIEIIEVQNADVYLREHYINVHSSDEEMKIMERNFALETELYDQQIYLCSLEEENCLLLENRQCLRYSLEKKTKELISFQMEMEDIFMLLCENGYDEIIEDYFRTPENQETVDLRTSYSPRLLETGEEVQISYTPPMELLFEITMSPLYTGLETIHEAVNFKNPLECEVDHISYALDLKSECLNAIKEREFWKTEHTNLLNDLTVNTDHAPVEINQLNDLNNVTENQKIEEDIEQLRLENEEAENELASCRLEIAKFRSQNTSAQDLMNKFEDMIKKLKAEGDDSNLQEILLSHTKKLFAESKQNNMNWVAQSIISICRQIDAIYRPVSAPKSNYPVVSDVTVCESLDILQKKVNKIQEVKELMSEKANGKRRRGRDRHYVKGTPQIRTIVPGNKPEKCLIS